MKLRWFLLGGLSVLVVAAIVGGELIRTAGGFSTLAAPSAAERWAARLARSSALPSDARSKTNPVAKTPEVIAEASAHWADHCASCHANDGSGDTVLGKHLYPPAPDMRTAETQKLADGELFYIIQNGIRLTGMPGWGGPGSAHEEDSWKLVHFIRHLPELTPEEKAAMKKLNPKSPDDLREEEEERKFLEGEETDETVHEHHHH